MAEIGSAFISVLPSMRGFGREVSAQASSELDPAGKSIGKRFGSTIGLAAKAGLAAGGIALAAFTKSAVDSASAAQQSLGATETVFGKFAGNVVQSSNAAAQAYGLSANEYRENANLMGALFKNQGVALSELGASTDQMIGKASDLAATFGGTTADAVGALSSAFKGEFDSLERYGISLRESTISAELAARGQENLTGAALAAAKQQAITDLIFKQSKDSLGAFANESGTLAGQQQRLSAQFENFKATLGTALLPVLTQFFGYLNTTALPALTQLGSFLSANVGPAFERVRSVVASFFGGSSGDAGKWAANIKSIVRDAVTIATTLWNTFGKDIMRYATQAFNAVKQIVQGGLTVVAGIFKTISAIMRGDWGAAWDGIKQIVSGAKDVVIGILRGLANIAQTVISVGFKALIGIMRAAWDGITSAVKAGAERALSFVRSLPGRAADALGNLGSYLYDKGRELIQGMIDGIKSMIGAVGDAIGGVADTVKGFLPGSPVKEGPLRSWNNGGAGKRLMDLLAGGITASEQKVADAMSSALDKVVAATEAKRDKIKGVIDTLRSSFDSLAGSVSNAFTGDLFQAETGRDFIRNLTSSYFQLKELSAAFATLRGYGIPSAFLARLFASGNAGIILDLAKDQGMAQQAASILNGIDMQAAGLGSAVATAEYGAELQKQTTRLDRIEQNTRALQTLSRDLSKALSAAVSAGQRSAGPTSSGGKRGK